MMYLQILHPNELATKPWKTVDEASSLLDVLQILQSPTFEWFHGLLVRVVSHERVEYEGIFGSSEVLNVSNYPTNTQSEISSELRTLFTAWPSTINAGWMMHIIQSNMSINIVQELTLAIGRKALSFVPHYESRPENAVLAARQHFNGTLSDAQFAVAKEGARAAFIERNNLTLDGDHSRSIEWHACFAAYLCTELNRPYAYKVADSVQKCYPPGDSTIANFIRSSVPFYELAVRIAR